VLGAVVIFPYLPGSKSPAFQGISIFLGILLSLGSTSAVAHAVAGTILTYMRPFQLGDRVRISEVVGDVVEKNLLDTRIQTIKNEIITIPNANILNGQMWNYSTSARENNLILHTTVTIGYDAPWRTVHELLIGAALSTQGIQQQPRPFVLQTALNDFYVSYELNAYTADACRMIQIYSSLHQNIQDRFNEAGVEIMSPHYSQIRDGSTVTIPEAYRPSGYQAPGIRVENVNSSVNARHS
jgi:small-conductance mechanosensitive channel